LYFLTENLQSLINYWTHVLKLPLYYGSWQGFFGKTFDIKTLEFFPSRKRKIGHIKKELIAIQVKKIEIVGTMHVCRGYCFIHLFDWSPHE